MLRPIPDIDETLRAAEQVLNTVNGIVGALRTRVDLSRRLIAENGAVLKDVDKQLAGPTAAARTEPAPAPNPDQASTGSRSPAPVAAPDQLASAEASPL